MKNGRSSTRTAPQKPAKQPQTPPRSKPASTGSRQKASDPPPANVKIRRIDCSDPKAGKHLSDLRRQIGSQGDVVSPKSRELAKRVFGETLSPVQVAERICNDVRKDGIAAVIKYSELFDKVKLTRDKIRIPVEELRSAHSAARHEFLETIRNIRQNVLSFQMGLLHSDAVLSVTGSHEIQLRYRPLRRVGIYVPGGAASYPSTLLMTVCLAQAAGVQEIAVATPPSVHGGSNPNFLAACFELGVTEVYRMGGAQAIAALAYGAEGVPAVDMIVGPGNTYVAMAKKFVQNQVAIDCQAGPSEVVIVADESSQPEFVAADLIAQAEHSPGVCVLVTWHPELLDEVTEAINRQIVKLDRGDLARESLEKFGAMVLAKDKQQAIQITNQLAPEHLHIQTRDPEAIGDRIDNAGAIFLGHFTPVALGDYAAGPSHVLPTGGTARFSSGLTVNSFLRCSSVMTFTQRGIRHLAEDVVRLAEAESLTGHAASVAIRTTDSKHLTARPPKKPVKTPST